MASSSLSSASAYLNNLLLARGLLQDGKAIRFADPARDGDTDQTMSRVINLVHDLVLRRDREAEQRELLVSNIRTLRVEEGQRVLDLQKTQDKNAELARTLTTAEAQERALKAAAKKVEAQSRDLKEQMLKMKSTLDQVRAKCVSDVRKRDVELEKLKGHLASMQRGKREASGMKVNVINPQAFMRAKSRNGQETEASSWSLEKETNDFLAALVNETSTENVSLRNIVTETMDALKILTGIELELAEDPIGVPGQYRPSREIVACETLATQMTSILEHCRTILKDPSFVPIEEVQIREEEIIKLRIGWEKMASRWKEAVTMMDSWRRQGKDAFDVRELSNLEFGRSIAVLPNGDPVLDEHDELSAILFDHSRISQDDEPEHLSHVDYPVLNAASDEDSETPPEADESDLDIPPEPSPKRLASSPARRGIKLQRPLREINNIPADRVDSGTFSMDGTADDVENLPPRHQSKIPRKLTPPMSVTEKLAAVEAEAKAVQQTKAAPHKRKAPSKKTSRRRSTLSPDELASLMGVR